MFTSIRSQLNAYVNGNRHVDPFLILQSSIAFLMTVGMKVLGPVLILFACSIVGGLVYVDFTLVLPLICGKTKGFKYCIHCLIGKIIITHVTPNVTPNVTPKVCM